MGRPEAPAYPTYADLRTRTDGTPGTSWGLFDDPDRGTPSFAGADQVRHGAQLVRTGEALGLDYPIDAFFPGMSATRKPPEHVMFGNHPAHRDDYLDNFYLQGSSQVDGLRHRRSDEVGFYGGTPDEEVRPGTTAIGIQVWADRPIVSRGVLLDLAAERDRQGRPIDHEAGEPLGLDLIEQTMHAQGTQLRDGDIVMLRTGWAGWFLGLDDAARRQQQSTRRATGMAQSEDFVAWAWDRRIALLAADTFAVECLPVVAESPFRARAPHDAGMMHQEFLAKLGLPLGELWRLDQLAERMAALGRDDCLLVVKPLNVVGATGSPANATAIL